MVTDTPSLAYAAAAEPVPEAAPFIAEMFFLIDPLRVSTETSTSSAAYMYSCSLCVEMPVTVDAVRTLSAYAAPSLDI